MNLEEKKLLRFAAPELYKKMAEVFSTYHIHPHDVHAVITKLDDTWEVSLRFASDFSETIPTYFTTEQVNDPDEIVTHFFEEAAGKCKTQLIADYYKMIKL